jgi:RNA polymerase sigma-70 factor, ECF subfamily
VSTGTGTGTGTGTEQAYARLRPLMFAIAYRMLGSVTEAEDIVQEAFLRYHKVLSESAEPQSPKAYLSVVTTRLCIDQLKSAQSRREAYIGEWLPEPLLDERMAAGQRPASDPAELAEQAESLSMAFLLLLERLSPVERAVFLLHDVFGYDYTETAAVVGKSRDYCRQLARRARQHIEAERPRFEPSRQERDELAARFFAAATNGDVDGLRDLLAADVTVYGDSAGLRPSWPTPITGSVRVSRLMAGLVAQLASIAGQLRPVQVNGQPGALMLADDGALICVLVLEFAAGKITAIRSVISRQKLGHLAPLADIPALFERRRASLSSPEEL